MTPTKPFDPEAAARFIANAHATRAEYCNLPPDIAPRSVDEAYAAQEAVARLWASSRGPVGGLKIATTTKIMQQLMGIDHPCGGMVFARRIHQSPAVIDKSGFVSLVVECELAVRLARDLPDTGAPCTREDARAAVGSVMAAFELIEDRHAVYKSTSALSLIADNAWNGGIVLGPEQSPPAGDLNAIAGTLEVNGISRAHGATDDPMGALAWVANLAASRGRPMKAGQVVITGSVIPTLPISAAETFRFTLAGVGTTEMRSSG
jgi:2-keto-4-pentenoate hydratase